MPDRTISTATASLDVRVQAVVLELLTELRREFEMTYLFVSHDLAVVRHICDRLLVMHSGRIIDSGPTEELLTAPSHPYTRGLVEAIPRLSSDGGLRSPAVPDSPYAN